MAMRKKPTTKKRPVRSKAPVAKKRRAAKKKPARRRDAAAPAAREHAFALSDDALEEALVSGEHRALLEACLGEEAYDELRTLSTRARASRVRGGPRVLLLPGIMGSKLGERGVFFDDVIWIDPVEIAAGGLWSLRLPGGDPDVEAVGVLLSSYLKLKLTLRIAGFDAAFHPFDWRRGIADLGRQLADRIRGEAGDGAGDLYLVAHSMGGLVSRAAMKALADTGGDDADRVRRLIMLGTPNFGSFSPVQALSGYHGLVGKVAALDLAHSHETLVNRVFNTFPGLYQMLPARQRYSALDLYDLATWPPTGFAPRQDLLSAAPGVHDALAPGAGNMTLVAGVDQETIVGVRREDDEFVFTTSMEGDGTVPLDFARLDDVQTYYVKESHGSLPNNGDVARAVIDVLESGRTDVLAQSWTPSRRGAVREVRGRELVGEPFDGRRGEEVSERELRHLLDEFAAPLRAEPRPAPAPAGGVAADLSDEPIVIGRKRQSRVDITVAQGSITQLDTRAIVLGVFKDVPPAGAALAIDRRLGGAVSEFSERRLFRANVGDVFMMPASRSRLRTDTVVFVGLGAYDDFSTEMLRQVAENVARVLVRTHVDEFGTVLLGAGSGIPVGEVLGNLVEGFLRGLGGSNGRLRAITFVEQDLERFGELHRAVLRLANTSLFDEVEATVFLDELPPEPAPAPGAREYIADARQPLYLLVRELPDLTASATDPAQDAAFTLRASLLTAGARATVLTDEIDVDAAALNAHLGRIETSAFTAANLSAFGRRLAALTLPPLVRKALARFDDHPLVVIHDARTSRIPWETIDVSESGVPRFPAAGEGISRKYEAEDLSVAKWLEERRLADRLSVLLVVNPTEDLPGAEDEGHAVKAILDADPAIELTELWNAQATLAAVRAAFRSGRFDVVHYAGHAFFDPWNRARSGLICHGDRVLRGTDVAHLAHAPALVFFNACESGRVRARGSRDGDRLRSAEERDGGRATAVRIERSVGVAEALLRAGVANFLGTYWPVGDLAAGTFGRVFYREVARGATIGQALKAGRAEVRVAGSVDWADYLHYGSPGFRLKR